MKTNKDLRLSHTAKSYVMICNINGIHKYYARNGYWDFTVLIHKAKRFGTQASVDDKAAECGIVYYKIGEVECCTRLIEED